MDQFQVYYEVDASDLTSAEHKAIIGTRWVLRWKGEEVRCRLVAQGYSQELDDPDDSFASTPQLVSLKILLLFALAKKYKIIIHQ